MTHDTPFDGSIETTDDFEAALGDLLAAASGNGIELEGSWEYRSVDPGPDYEVMIIELARHAGTD